MNNIFLILCTILAVEFFLRLSLFAKVKSFKNLLLQIKNILFIKKISDLKKEKEIKKYSLKLILHTSSIFFSLLIVILPFIFFLVCDYFYQFEFLYLLISTKGFIVSVIIGMTYIKLRSYVFK